MKVTKVIIKTEEMEIPEVPYMHFVKHEPLRAFSAVGEPSSFSDFVAEKETYEVKEVRDYFNGKLNERKYLVKVDKNRLFADLTKIESQTFADAVSRATEAWKKRCEDAFYEGEGSGYIRYCNKPWWKRLFKIN